MTKICICGHHDYDHRYYSIKAEHKGSCNKKNCSCMRFILRRKKFFTPQSPLTNPVLRKDNVVSGVDGDNPNREKFTKTNIGKHSPDEDFKPEQEMRE